ncbi:MAG: hypothetical protein GX654_21345 [Desulfatiglans sp.]|nr:hypothetical protein [Desulfatiglans sp.]
MEEEPSFKGGFFFHYQFLMLFTYCGMPNLDQINMRIGVLKLSIGVETFKTPYPKPVAIHYSFLNNNWALKTALTKRFKLSFTGSFPFILPVNFIFRIIDDKAA